MKNAAKFLWRRTIKHAWLWRALSPLVVALLLSIIAWNASRSTQMLAVGVPYQWSKELHIALLVVAGVVAASAFVSAYFGGWFAKKEGMKNPRQYAGDIADRIINPIVLLSIPLFLLFFPPPQQQAFVSLQGQELVQQIRMLEAQPEAAATADSIQRIQAQVESWARSVEELQWQAKEAENLRMIANSDAQVDMLRSLLREEERQKPVLTAAEVAFFVVGTFAAHFLIVAYGKLKGHIDKRFPPSGEDT